MPILQGDPWGAQIGAALAGFGQTVQQQKDRKRQEQIDAQKRQDQLRQQAIANTLAQDQLKVSQGNLKAKYRELGLDESGNPDPRIAAIMAGLGATGMTGETPTPQPQGAPGGFAQFASYGQQPKTQGDPRLQGVLAGIGAAGQQQTTADDVARFQRLGNTALERAAQADEVARKLFQVAPNSPQYREAVSTAERLHRDATGYFAEVTRAQQQHKTAEDEARTSAERDFGMHEMDLPKDPHLALGVLRVRQNEEHKRGFFSLEAKTDAKIKEIQAELDRQQREADIQAQRDFMRKMSERRAGQTDVRISMSRDRATSAAGDPQAFADVSGRLRGAKTRDAAQAILDSPEGSLLSDRQYNRLQKQVDETFGGRPNQHVDQNQARADDFKHAKEIYDQPNSNKNAIVNAFAAKWKLKPQEARAYFK